jgi:hypothetical protein
LDDDDVFSFYGGSAEQAFALLERKCGNLRFAFSVDLDENNLDSDPVFDYGN